MDVPYLSVTRQDHVTVKAAARAHRSGPQQRHVLFSSLTRNRFRRRDGQTPAPEKLGRDWNCLAVILSSSTFPFQASRQSLLAIESLKMGCNLLLLEYTWTHLPPRDCDGISESSTFSLKISHCAGDEICPLCSYPSSPTADPHTYRRGMTPHASVFSGHGRLWLFSVRRYATSF